TRSPRAARPAATNASSPDRGRASWLRVAYNDASRLVQRCTLRPRCRAIDAVGAGTIATGPVVRRAARAGAVFVPHLAAAVAITWPLAAHLSTHLPAPAGPLHIDQYYVGWALAWQTHALVTAPAHFANANIYWPAAHTLFYGTPGFALLPIFAP